MGLETGEVRGSSSMVDTKEAKPSAAAAKQTTTVVQGSQEWVWESCKISA